MLGAGSERALVYQVLDDALADTGVSPGARGTIFSVIDGLRASGAQADEVRLAESVSIELHKLQQAIQRNDADDAKKVRDQLREIAAELLNSRIQTKCQLQ